MTAIDRQASIDRRSTIWVTFSVADTEPIAAYVSKRSTGGPATARPLPAGEDLASRILRRSASED